MPTIRVRFFAAAREAFGTKERSLSAGTIDELVAVLTKDSSDEARTVLSRSSFLINAIAATDRHAVLKDGDTVDVLPPFAGG